MLGYGILWAYAQKENNKSYGTYDLIFLINFWTDLHNAVSICTATNSD